LSGFARALAAVMGLLAPPALAAEPEPPEAHLPEVVVRLPRLAPEDATAAATVVDAARFAGQAKDVAALVATSPGVAVQEYGGLGQVATVSIRGAGAEGVKVLLDGLPLNGGLAGSVDLSSIPRAWIDRIEVVRGTEGARYGAGALGGVVNVITRPARPGSWSARLSGGSFLTGSLAADGALGGEGWGGLLSGGFDGSGGRFPYRRDPTPSVPGGEVEERRDHNRAAWGGLLAKGWLRTLGGRLDGLVQLSGGERELPGPPTNASWRGRQGEERALGAVQLALPAGEQLSVVVGAHVRAEHLDLAIPALARFGGVADQLDLFAALRAEVAWRSGPSLLTAGASAGGERLSGDGFATAHDRPELSAFVADELLLLGSRLRVAPALRADRVGPFDGVSAKLGASLAIAGPLSVRASAGRSYRPPTFAELFLQQGTIQPNPELRAETARGVDGALVIEGPQGLASAGLFASLYDDLIAYRQVSLREVGPFNVGRARAWGAEVEAATAPLGALGFTAQAAYTWLRTESLQGGPREAGNDIPFRARHRLYGRIGLAPGSWDVHGEIHAVGRQFRDALNDPDNAVPAALVFHLGGSARLWRAPEIWLHLDVKNLADDRTLQDGFGNPLPGRMVMVALRAASEPREGERR